MRKIATEYLQTGMKLARPVYGSDGGILLSSDVVLKDEYIGKIAEKGILSVCINDSISEDIFFEDVVSEKEHLKAKMIIKEIFTKIRSKSTFGNTDFQYAKGAINDILDQVTGNRNLMYNLNDITPEENYLFGHSVNVCILSVLTGLALGYSSNQLEVLAVGALFHDIGMAFIPLQIINKPGKFTREELKEVGKHPEHSLSLLRQASSVSSISRMVSFQHHERLGGGGYPQGLKKDDILEMSQIVGLADVFDALTTERAYRKPLLPKSAIDLISGTGGKYFSPNIVSALLDCVAAYPVGIVVRLNNGEIAIVTNNKRKYSLSPEVRVLMESGGIKEGHKNIDLAENKDLSIEKVMSEEEVRKALHMPEQALSEK